MHTRVNVRDNLSVSVLSYCVGSRDGAQVIRLSGTVAQWLSGTVAQWYSGTVAQWLSGSVAQWHSGSMAQWPSGSVTQWLSGRHPYLLSLLTSLYLVFIL